MSLREIINVAIGLIAVLASIGLIAQLLRRYKDRFASSKGSTPIEVLHRVSLTPRQGLAVVRITARFFAVSMGEGGIKLLAELDSNDLYNIKSISGDNGSKDVAQTAAPALKSEWRDLTALPKLANTAKKRPSTEISTGIQNSKAQSGFFRKRAPEQRISYVAPIEEFKAVLSIAMNGTTRS